jgi:hypothetical protein
MVVSMKKGYIVIIAIICFGLGIVGGLGLSLIKEKDSNPASPSKVYVEDKKSLDEIQRLEKELEDSNKSREKTQEDLSNSSKKIEELKLLLKSANFANSEYQDVVNKTMNDFYSYAFYMHSSVYCGDISVNDEFVDKAGNSYFESYTFKSINEIKSFYKKFISDKFFNDNIVRYFTENNNKLYCLDTHKGALIFKADGSIFKVVSASDDKIDVYGIALVNNMNEVSEIVSHAILINENGNWVVNEYHEFN